MEDTDNVYVYLREHLDKQAVGFPATDSGVEIRVLKHFFDPEQAGIALHLNYRPQSAMDIFSSVKNSGLSLEKVKSMLEGMVSKGAIGIMEKDGTEYYFTMPLLVGMVEWHHTDATPQYSADLGEYMRSGFVKAFAASKVSQMRTIPVEKASWWNTMSLPTITSEKSSMARMDRSALTRACAGRGRVREDNTVIKHPV